MIYDSDAFSPIAFLTDVTFDEGVRLTAWYPGLLAFCPWTADLRTGPDGQPKRVTPHGDIIYKGAGFSRPSWFTGISGREASLGYGHTAWLRYDAGTGLIGLCEKAKLDAMSAEGIYPCGQDGFMAYPVNGTDVASPANMFGVRLRFAAHACVMLDGQESRIPADFTGTMACRAEWQAAGGLEGLSTCPYIREAGLMPTGPGMYHFTVTGTSEEPVTIRLTSLYDPSVYTEFKVRPHIRPTSLKLRQTGSGTWVNVIADVTPASLADTVTWRLCTDLPEGIGPYAGIQAGSGYTDTSGGAAYISIRIFRKPDNGHIWAEAAAGALRGTLILKT